MCPLLVAESSTPHADSDGVLAFGWGLRLVHLRVWAGVGIWMGIPSCLLIWGMYARGSLQRREWEWKMGAGLGIVGGAIGHSLSVMAARGHLLKEVPMACGHLLWWALIAIHQWW